MDPLVYEGMSHEDKNLLGHLSKHPGFVVFRKLMDDACRQKVALVIKLDPEDPDYDSKLKGRQQVARVTNEVCSALIKSIEMHAKNAENEEKAQEFQDQLQVMGIDSSLVGERFGSTVIKSPKGKQ